MKTRGRNLKERICALLLAVIMPLTGILPGTAITADAAQGDNVTIEFTVNVENPTITVKDNEETGDPRVVTKDSISGKYEIDLTEGRTYTYIVSKTGYEDVKETDFAPTTAMSSKTVNINMTTSAIAVDTSDSLTQTIGDSKTINVTNKIEGAVYSCTSSDSAVVSITGDQSSGWKIEAKSSGTAEITFTNDKGSTSKSIHVTVN